MYAPFSKNVSHRLQASIEGGRLATIQSPIYVAVAVGLGKGKAELYSTGDVNQQSSFVGH